MRELKLLLILLFVGLCLMTFGIGQTMDVDLNRDMTDEAVRARALELGMMDVKDALEE